MMTWCNCSSKSNNYKLYCKFSCSLRSSRNRSSKSSGNSSLLRSSSVMQRYKRQPPQTAWSMIGGTVTCIASLAKSVAFTWAIAPARITRSRLPTSSGTVWIGSIVSVGVYP